MRLLGVRMVASQMSISSVALPPPLQHPCSAKGRSDQPGRVGVQYSTMALDDRGAADSDVYFLYPLRADDWESDAEAVGWRGWSGAAGAAGAAGGVG
ncbi:hypothetical protein BP00DRAFT_263712 [Aspergillus indologenus CBS 114.80]|uniref:Uncharacterized protein n=1 Tax=Aspergillus indologenus CBS 114.80 TaxID=1450541 RepID=A0A2V5HWY4_9EURO|nr:hypothetical protein BP00DRAFT_263712 [Aspergillus indologenus CBS 114.80]